MLGSRVGMCTPAPETAPRLEHPYFEVKRKGQELRHKIRLTPPDTRGDPVGSTRSQTEGWPRVIRVFYSLS